MRLEKIVLNGFKSFADKTEFVFDSPITGIVGPNGCGKSNVVDAVRWVLGEQSVRSLRSGQMADVIFSGSTSRKPLGSAEVALVLANTTGKLPVEADRLQISRRIYQNGESEYKINNKTCRLKDIREMFLDTGVGARGYSIIEQGQVEQLLRTSKTDRRVIFEEAAGISKYKTQKIQALRKLERTEQNLLRLADVLGEILKRLRSVKLQAGKARNYLQYSEKLKQLQVNYSLAEFDTIHTAQTEKQDALQQTEQRYAAVAADVAKNDSLTSRLGTEIVDTENQLNHTDNALLAVQSKIDQNLQRIEFLQSRIGELQQRSESAGRKIEQLCEQKKVLHNDCQNYEHELQLCEKQLQEKSLAAEQIKKSIQEVNNRCTSLAADLEDEKSGIIDIVRTTAQLHNELQSISVHRNNLSHQKDRLSGRASDARTELEQLLTEKARHEARLGDIEKVIEQLQQRLGSERQKTGQISERIAAEQKRLNRCRETRSALRSELAVLTDMETRREGLNDAVKTILQKRSAQSGQFGYVQGILADLITADVKYANAVEAALEGRADALVVNSSPELLSQRQSVEQLGGRVKFLCADRIEPFVDSTDLSAFPQAKGRVIEFVKYPHQYAPLLWKLLGKIIVIDSIDTAIELAGRLGPDYRFVTLNGQYFAPGGSVKLGPLGTTAGLISRKSRLRQLNHTIRNTLEDIAVIEQQLEHDDQQNQHLAGLCKDLRTAIYEANTEKTQITSKLNALEQNVERLRQEQPLIAGEIHLLEEQIAQSVRREYNSKQKLQEMETVNRQRCERIKQLEADFDTKKQQQQQMLERQTDLKVALGQISEQAKALKQSIAAVRRQIQENHTAGRAAGTEIQNCTEQLACIRRDILNCETTVSDLFVQKEDKQRASRDLHHEIDRLLQRRKDAEQLVRQKRSEQAEIEQNINQLKIELSQLDVRAQNLIERVREQFDIDLVESYKTYQKQQVDWDGVREEITQLRGKIERLGNVNLGAIDEQEQLEKRHTFLADQVEDLNRSRNQLQQLINRLNKISCEKFTETFEQIRGHFQQIFRKLFGGGKADILLEDTEDVLEAGIEIMARPPGKETRSISLLSGGEKTMTAIALLFAVFKTRPSPFCLLDEVDAALDEANNERFNLLIRQFQADSQFIIITHAKRTMSIADVLYGVTMQTQGVSKKISVKFSQVTDDQTAAVA